MLLSRLYRYQLERFPVLVHGVLIAAFSFSAIGYSRQLRGAGPGFIAPGAYLLCLFTNLALFFMLRVADEHKDAADDLAHRPYLPVPRGLISLAELRWVGFVWLSLAVVLNVALVPAVLPLLAVTLGYLLLMRYEFFAPQYLRARMALYMVSHMLIIPLADVYASGYDWRLAGVAPAAGLLFFFGVSYCNGIVLEIGRKLRTPEAEEPGVETYTRLWGLTGACLAWVLALFINFMLAVLAVRYAGHTGTIPVLAVCFGLALVPWALFLRKPTVALSKWVEGVSLVWALVMYLAIGGVPQLLALLK